MAAKAPTKNAPPANKKAAKRTPAPAAAAPTPAPAMKKKTARKSARA